MRIVIFLCCCLLVTNNLIAANNSNVKTASASNTSKKPVQKRSALYLRIRIVDPFIELHTGPGINFPIYDVLERGEEIEFLRRKTDWYQVRGSLNRIGWVQRSQMDETLTLIGEQSGVREAILDNLRTKFRFDTAVGQFDDQATVLLRLGYRTNKNIMLEFVYSQLSGLYSNSPLYQGNVLLELYTDHDFRPFVFMGVSKFKNVPNSATDTSAYDLDLLNAGFGLNYYLTERFLFRFEIGDYIVVKGNNRNDEFLNYNIGFSFYF